MELLYYPGCSVEYTAKAYDVSTRAVCQKLGVDLKELEDWNCCGATTYMSVRELVSHGNSARNLALAEKQGYKEMVAVCPACQTVLHKTNDYMEKDPEFAQLIRQGLKAAGLDYTGGVKVRHLIDVVVNDIGLDAVRNSVTKPLGGLKVAAYHGCMLTRPYGTIDSSERPTIMDRLLAALGAEPVEYPLTAKCCGGMVVNTETEKVVPVVAGLLRCARDMGADCIAVACPLCHMNLDFYQPEANKFLGGDYTTPVAYFTQLMGLAFGCSPKELGFGGELVSTGKLVAQYA
jgi:heterodisulfide reductase subunit B